MEKKFSKEVMQQLEARKLALQSMQVLAQMAQREYQIYVNEQIAALGLDAKKQYSVENDGTILEIKREKILDDSKESGELKTEGTQ